MNTIDEIMEMIEHFGDLVHKAMGEWAEQEDFDEREAVKTDLITLITQAIADARADGAREMREVAAMECDLVGREDSEPTSYDFAMAIRALPLPTKREPVRLTDSDLESIAHKVTQSFFGGGGMNGGDSWDAELSRAIETAVLAANGLTK